MFESAEPSETDFYDADDAYSKTVLRQAMRHDIHVHRLLSARIAVDTGTLMHFLKQDPRVQGYEFERAQQRFNSVSHNSMQLFARVPEAVNGEAEVDDVAELLVEEDKKA